MEFRFDTREHSLRVQQDSSKESGQGPCSQCVPMMYLYMPARWIVFNMKSKKEEGERGMGEGIGRLGKGIRGL